MEWIPKNSQVKDRWKTKSAYHFELFCFGTGYLLKTPKKKVKCCKNRLMPPFTWTFSNRSAYRVLGHKLLNTPNYTYIKVLAVERGTRNTATTVSEITLFSVRFRGCGGRRGRIDRLAYRRCRSVLATPCPPPSFFILINYKHQNNEQEVISKEDNQREV